MQIFKKTCLVFLSLLLLASTAQAEFMLTGKTAEEQGLAIATERKNRDLGWGDSESAVTMILRNSQGEESVREIRLKSLEVDGDGDKGLTIFDKPKDVKAQPS